MISLVIVWCLDWKDWGVGVRGPGCLQDSSREVREIGVAADLVFNQLERGNGKGGL